MRHPIPVDETRAAARRLALLAVLALLGLAGVNRLAESTPARNAVPEIPVMTSGPIEMDAPGD